MTDSSMIITNSSLSKISRELINKKIDNKDIYFRFTKILISDGTFPLTDNSEEIDEHIYAYSVSEIARTNNNILMSAELTDTAKINLQEIGLYYEDDDGQHLFSLINNISLHTAGKNLTYKLILLAKLDINVVNTVAFPEIVVEGGVIPPSSDFRTIQQVYTYLLINLERLIKLNALGIGQYNGGSQATINPAIMSDIKPVGVGYNKAQVLYRFLKELANYKDNFVATNNFALAKTEFTPKEVTTLNPDSFVEIGDMKVIQGIANDFSTTSYVKSTNAYNAPEKSTWEYHLNFTTGHDVSTPQTIVDFAQVAVNQPLILGIRPIGSNNNGNCFLSMGIPDTISVKRRAESEGHVFTRSSTKDINGITYYTWVCNESIGFNHHISYNSLVSSNGVVTISASSNMKTLPKINPLIGDSWNINLPFTTSSNTTNEQYLFASLSKGVAVSIYNKGLKIYLSSDRTNWDIANGTVAYSSELEINPNTSYTLTFSYDSLTDNTFAYKVHLINEDIGEGANILTISNSTPVIIADQICLGYSSIDSGKTFTQGKIDLKSTNISINDDVIWNGLSVLDMICTREYNPTINSSIPYDSDGYSLPYDRAPYYSIAQKTSGKFIDQNLFSVEPNKTYSVIIKHGYNDYKVEYAQGLNSNNYFEVFSQTSSNNLINPVDVLYGIQLDGTEFINPFLGLINLDKIYFSFILKDDYGNIINSETYNFLESTVKDIDLTDYFHIPSYAYSHNYFTVKNLGNYPNSILDVVEGAIKGNTDDRIDFLKANGFSLSTKIDLNTTQSRVILAKGNIDQENYYFILEQVNYGEGSSTNNEIVFTLYLPYETVTMSKELTPNILRDYTNYPITLTITSKDGVLKMYKNTELIASTTFTSYESQSLTSMYITNRTSNNYEESLEEQIVHDILCFDGELQPEDLYYVTNILGTNF